MNLFYEHFDSPCGEISIVFDDKETLFHLDFPDQGTERQNKLLKKRYKVLNLTEKPSKNLRIKVLSYLNGDSKALDDITCNTGGTDFQRKVWQNLKTIPTGETRSYAQMADYLGNPKAVRAVARANALNPISILYPCHRVIGSDGSLTGYAGGLKRKEWLLKLEGAL